MSLLSKWGHATSYCFSLPNCLKCSENYLTKDWCKVANSHAERVNFKGEHPVNSFNCGAYISLRIARQIERKNIHDKYQLASLPKVNPLKKKKQDVGERRIKAKENKSTKSMIEENPFSNKSLGEYSGNPFDEVKNNLKNHINIIEF